MIGVAIGLASAVAPVYISEVAPPESRGRLVSFFQLAVTIGILVAYLVGLAFDHSEGWRWMLGLGCVPALALGFGMLRMPQSPRWLVMTGDDFAARATLAKIRVDDPDTIDMELDEIKESLDDKPGAWSDLLQPVVKAALVVGVGLAILQQVTGINTVIYYAPTIVEFTGVNSSAGSILASVGVGIINVVMTVVALRLLDQAGRRTLLMIGVSGMVISLFALGAAFIGGGGSTVASVIAIVSLMTYVASFAISLGPIFWLLNAEIYPLAVRSKAAGIGTMANWIFNFIVSLTFLLLIEAARPDRRLLVLRRRSASSPSGSAGSSSRRRRGNGWRTYKRSSRPKSTPKLAEPAGYPPRMRIDEIIAARQPTFSVEFFPPKTAEATEQLYATARALSHLEPDFVSVTYGAGGVHPRRHGRDHQGAEGRPRLRDDGPPQLRRRDDRGAGGRRSTGSPRRGSRTSSRCAATRREARPTSSSPRAGSAAPRSWPPSSAPAGTSRSAAPASRRCTRRRPTSRPTSAT